MNVNKIVVIVLILVVITFVVLVLQGSLTNDQPKQSNSGQAKAEAKTFRMPSWGNSIEYLLSGLREKVVLPCEQKSPVNSDRICEKLVIGNSNVPPANEPILPFLKKTTFRTAKLVLISGEASVFYTDRIGGKNLDNPQKFELPNPENGNSKSESIVILEKGGILSIICKAGKPCQIGQQ